MSQTFYANLANDRLIVIEQYAAALRNLVEQAKYLTPCGDDLRYDCCDASIEKGHADHCTFAAAIAEAERLLK